MSENTHDLIVVY